MKKILFAAAALVAFAACTNDDVVSRLEGPAIAFDNAFVENTTRAAQDISKDNLADFGVYGSVMKDSNVGMIFENTLVTKSGDAYTYSPAQYWVDNATYNFVALAPHTNAKWNFNTSDAKSGFIAFDNEAAAGEQDLLFASANRTTASITSAPAPVAFTFNHMLSRVKFSFTNGFVADSNIELKVTDVKIVNAHKTGELQVVDGVVAQDWFVADNAVAEYTFVRPFGNLDVDKLAEGGNGETDHYYLIPANAEYTVTFDVEIFQAGVSLKKTTRQAVVSLDMAKGYSYNVKATLNDKNASADGELYPIEFTVDAVEDWADYTDVEAKPTQYVKSAAALVEAVANGGEIFIANDITLDAPLSIKTTTRAAAPAVELDLQGHTISYESDAAANSAMINIAAGNTLIIKDSEGTGKISYKYTGAGDASFGWGTYTITNYGGTLIVENGTVEMLSDLNGNGSVVHMYCAVYQYSGSTTINGGTISTPTYRSARLWKGDMTVNGGVLEGQLWVQAVDNTAVLNINGGSFAPRGVDGSSVFVSNDKYDVAMNVTAGTFATKLGCSNYTKDGVKGSVSGGSYGVALSEDLIANGYQQVLQDGVYNVVPLN